ncbi:Peptide deformylase [Candidatus Hepatincolaceae symbiont of Richtersius coronifer]
MAENKLLTEPLIVYPNQVLRTKALEITNFNKDLLSIAMGMVKVMYQHNGIGLAANQIGQLQRIIVVDVEPDPENPKGGKNPQIFINPVIVEHSTKLHPYEEGCLSFPEMRAIIERPNEVIIDYLDLKGEKQRLQAQGLLCTCLQHEIDHLNGVLFIDHLSKLKRDLLLRKYKKEQNLLKM